LFFGQFEEDKQPLDKLRDTGGICLARRPIPHRDSSGQARQLDNNRHPSAQRCVRYGQPPRQSPAGRICQLHLLSLCAFCWRIESTFEEGLCRQRSVLNQFDLAAALAARCGGSGRFYGNTEALFATQMTWLGKAPAFGKAQGARLAKLSPAEGLKQIVRGVGIDAIMKTRGVTPAQLDACIVNKPAQDAVLGMTKEALDVRKFLALRAFLSMTLCCKGPEAGLSLNLLLKPHLEPYKDR
jgi:hypothetical protein